MNTVIVFSANYLVLVSLAIAGVIFFLLSREEKVSFVELALLSALLGLAFLKLAGHVIYDPRPFAVLHVAPLIPHPADNGFPSDHTLLATWLALLVWTFNRRAGVVLGILAVAIGAARVLALIHHPLDIVGSIVIALVAWGIARIVLQYFQLGRSLTAPIARRR